MSSLAEIEVLTKSYADARSKLAETLQNLDDQINALTRQFLPGLKVQVGLAKQRELNLSNAIEGSRELFKSPRSIIISGIKVGLRKGSGKLDWEDDELVIRLIKKHFPEQVDLLIKTTEKPRVKALDALTVAELKSIGVTAEDTGDVPFIKPVDSVVDKLVKKYLAEKKEKAEEAEEAA
jgi:hypothetical protein